MNQMKSSNPHREWTFWSVHAIGWGAYAISHYLGALLYSKPPGYIKVIFLAALAGFIVSAGSRCVESVSRHREDALR
jgi:hypothetical protein